MIALKETMSHTRGKKIKFVLIHVRKSIHEKLEKFGITSDVLFRNRIDMRSTGGQYHAVTRPSEVNFYSGIQDEEVGLLGSTDARDGEGAYFTRPGAGVGVTLSGSQRLGAEGYRQSPAYDVDIDLSSGRDATSLRNNGVDTFPVADLKQTETACYGDAGALTRAGLRSRSRDDPNAPTSAASVPQGTLPAESRL